ncbi:MAG: cytochrome oxidase subunit III [Rhodospirillaceae bacterium]|jgi:hypothetical protein|nr:cytochrome oxidase subunit III [Rhodospirillaceae bacterium]MBT3495462.1 cytochrome oxidase subunit III [Rhodospirillaceae bacterium]MBT3780108.1 cytochrome oxidase subunit III [Rhodospirillaceae bacterium]MBT3975495.1 cytochrome oxidase subunit III [Rhodospirillaceae bacterium]MBT4168006.1 cytochrome oxidase subunit III [Rhodospirillaceae bacterium]
MTPRRAWRYNVAGWLLFTASAAFFMWAAIRADDWINLIAALLFLVACLVFLVPVWRLRPPRD